MLPLIIQSYKNWCPGKLYESIKTPRYYSTKPDYFHWDTLTEFLQAWMTKLLYTAWEHSHFCLAKLVGLNFNYVVTTWEAREYTSTLNGFSGCQSLPRPITIALASGCSGLLNLNFSVPWSKLFFPTSAGTQSTSTSS